MKLSLNNRLVCTGTLDKDVLRRYFLSLPPSTEITLEDEDTAVSLGQCLTGRFAVADWLRGIRHDTPTFSSGVRALVTYWYG